MLLLIFSGNMRKILVDLSKTSKILVDFLSFLGKSVEFFVPNAYRPAIRKFNGFRVLVSGTSYFKVQT